MGTWISARFSVSPIPRWSTAMTDRDDLEVPGKRRHQQAPGVPVLWPAMHEQERRSLAPDDGVLAQLTGIDVPASERVGETCRRLDAPETEPGPSGVGSWVEDELTTISLAGFVWLRHEH